MQVLFEGKQYPLESGETVLDCLERGGAEVSSLCRNGACQSCILQTTGSVNAPAQSGLKAAWKKQGLFLACQCRPSTDLEVSRANVASTYPTRVLEVSELGEHTIRLWVERPAELSYQAGQFVQLRQPRTKIARPYSLASTPQQERLEFHVRVRPQGRMSEWLREAEGEPLELTGPFGECVYLEESRESKLMLAGTGTGLAPLLGVIRAAIAAGHQGEIQLFHGSFSQSGLYLYEELIELESAHENLQVIQCANEVGLDAALPGVTQEPIVDAVLKRWKVGASDIAYLCGNPDFVRMLKKKLYLGGCSLSNIYSDPFEAPAQVERV